MAVCVCFGRSASKKKKQIANVLSAGEEWMSQLIASVVSGLVGQAVTLSCYVCCFQILRYGARTRISGRYWPTVKVNVAIQKLNKGAAAAALAYSLALLTLAFCSSVAQLGSALWCPCTAVA